MDAIKSAAPGKILLKEIRKCKPSSLALYNKALYIVVVEGEGEKTISSDNERISTGSLSRKYLSTESNNFRPGA